MTNGNTTMFIRARIIASQQELDGMLLPFSSGEVITVESYDDDYYKTRFMSFDLLVQKEFVQVIQ